MRICGLYADCDSPHVPCHAINHFRHRPVETLRVGIRGAQEDQPRYPSRRDLCPAGPQWRRENDTDRHHLRHSRAERGQGHSRWTRHHLGLPRGARIDRAGAAGTAHRRLRKRLGDRLIQPWPVQQAEEPRLHRESAARAVAVGQEGRQDHDALGRHETPSADRKGAIARAAGSLPG